MSVPCDPVQGLVVVPAEIAGPSGKAVVRLALDTGATGTVVNVGILVAIGCDPALAVDRVQVTTGSGVEFTPRVPVKRLTALGCVRRQFDVLAHTLPPSAGVDGLLGLDFLRGRRLTLDLRAGKVTLR